MMTPRYQDVLRRQIEQIKQNAEDMLDAELDFITSPIEKVFLAEMFSFGWRPAGHFGDSDIAAARAALKDSGLVSPRDNDVSGVKARFYLTHCSIARPMPTCVTQPMIRLESRDIRPDFAFVISGEHGSKVIVELDGHDFHERTPEQAQADKSRDRELQRLGWVVMRFTGREVLQDPQKCFFEVGTILHAKIVTAAHEAKGGP